MATGPGPSGRGGVMSKVDGFKRGTNYNHKIGTGAAYGADVRALGALAAQGERCAKGEHDETVAEPNRVTWLAFGRRVEPGTRYCRFCSVILGRVSCGSCTSGLRCGLLAG